MQTLSVEQAMTRAYMLALAGMPAGLWPPAMLLLLQQQQLAARATNTSPI
jgi:hypothetical protein